MKELDIRFKGIDRDCLYQQGNMIAVFGGNFIIPTIQVRGVFEAKLKQY